MARSAKDLRDIINVSRLSIRDYSSDDISSGSELELKVENSDLSNYLSSRPNSAMSESSFVTFTELTRPGSSQGRRLKTSPTYKDFNGNTFRSKTAPVTSKQQSDEYLTFSHSGRKTAPLNNNEIITFPGKYTPVPPISKKECAVRLKRNTTLHDDAVKKGKEFDKMFQFLDGTIVGTWLEECNDILCHVNKFVRKNGNFIELVNFFLTNLSFNQYCELLDLEFSIIIDQVMYAFHAGIQDSHVEYKDLIMLTSSVLKEYPKALKRKNKGIKLLLDIIMIFCSDKDERYRKLLKNIKCSTDNKQNIQWLLALRAFGLISFISGVLKFYENILVLQKVFTSNEVSQEEHNIDVDTWCIEAIRKNYTDVVNYLISHQNVKLDHILDKNGRNAIFIAAIEGHPDMIYYLSKFAVQLDIDKPSITGNTALHFVVSKNDLETAAALLDVGAKVNMWNAEANGATPLHAAVMLDERDMVELLLRYGADKTVCMGIPATTTPLVLAKQLNHDDIAKLLE